VGSGLELVRHQRLWGHVLRGDRRGARGGAKGPARGPTRNPPIPTGMRRYQVVIPPPHGLHDQRLEPHHLPGGGEWDLIARLGIGPHRRHKLPGRFGHWYEFNSAKKHLVSLSSNHRDGLLSTIFLEAWRKVGVRRHRQGVVDDVT